MSQVESDLFILVNIIDYHAQNTKIDQLGRDSSNLDLSDKAQ